MVGEHVREKDSETKSDILASDCIMNYRTVQSFGSDEILIDEFQISLNEARESFVSL